MALKDSALVGPPESAGADLQTGTTVRARPTVVTRQRLTLRESLVDAWRSRHLLREFSSGLFFRQFQGFLLGPLLLPIQVGFATVGFTLIFGGIFDVKSVQGIPYYLFVLVGMFTWRVFDRSLIFTLRSFYRFKRVTGQFAFPLLLIPVAATMQGVLEWITYLVFIAGFITYYSIADGTLYFSAGPEVLFAPLGLLWALLLAWGVGFITGPIYVRARDIRFLIRMAIPFLMFMTPVVYPLDQLHGLAHTLAQVNPLTAVVELVREGFYGQGFSVPYWSFAVSIGVTVFTVTVGLAFLNRFGLGLIGADRLADEESDADAATL